MINPLSSLQKHHTGRGIFLIFKVKLKFWISQYLLGFIPYLFWNRTFEVKWHGFFQPKCSTCHPNSSCKSDIPASSIHHKWQWQKPRYSTAMLLYVHVSHAPSTKIGHFMTMVSFGYSALTLLVGRQEEIRPVKNWVVGAGIVIYPERGTDLHITKLMPLPLTISCSSKSRLVLPGWFRFSGTELPRLSWKKGR